MRTAAINSGLWGYVEPVSIAPTWVHMDRRTGTPACSAGYPTLRQGSVGVYVCVLQDALEVSGQAYVGIDGYFGANTARAVRSFQSQQGLSSDGIVGCQTWTRLTGIANGRWRE